jgi:DNA primase
VQCRNVAVPWEIVLLEHLKSRHLDISLHRVFIEGETATFPIYNLLGEFTGFQQYRPSGFKKVPNNPREGKYFTRGKGFWGLESWSFTNTIFIVEGLFDAARLTQRRISALAVLSCDPSKEIKDQLRLIRMQRPVVALCDNDSAGKRLGRLAHRSYTMLDDVGSASEEELISITRGHI